MKCYLLFIFGLVLTCSLRAQPIRVYPDAESFKNSQPIAMEHVAVVKRTDMDMSRNQGGPYKVITDDKATNRKLAYEYWAVETDSALFLNCESLIKSQGYVKVQYRTPEFLYFRVYDAKMGQAAVPVPIIIGGGMVGGIIAIAAAGAAISATGSFAWTYNGS